MKLFLHAIALLVEAVGALFIFLESLRLNETIIQLGFMGYDGPPNVYDPWFYHSGTIGFVFLLGGIITLYVVKVFWTDGTVI